MASSDHIRVLTINPGSTSTKVALFEGEDEIFSNTVAHDAAVLAEFKEPIDQLAYRKETIDSMLAAEGVDLSTIDATVGIGGSLEHTIGGVYAINDLAFEHAKVCHNGIKHPSSLGIVLARVYADEYGKPSFIVNPNDLDEFQDLARLTGIKGIYRWSKGHPLNQKEVGIRFAESKGKNYSEVNLVIAHIGGGISIGAHQKGLLIDMNDAVMGDGPMAPTRCGTIPVMEIAELCFKEGFDETAIRDLAQKTGGLVSHLGTADVLEIMEMIDKGDDYAQLVLDGMIYQIAKTIGSMATVLKGEVDGIILTGGISRSEYLVKKIREYVSWIQEVTVMPGEFEMEAMASGAIRALTGKEETREYTGKPPWNGFSR